MASRLKNDCSSTPGKSILLKFLRLWQYGKNNVTKFGSHGLSGFTVAANTVVVWNKDPLPVGNRVDALIWGGRNLHGA